MPFDELETITKDNEPPHATLSYMRVKGRGGKENEAKKPKLTVTLPTRICGVGKMKKHVLMIGSGADAGKLRIKGLPKEAVSKTAAVKPTEFKTHFIWRFGYVPRLGDEIFDQQKCPVTKISDDEFEIAVNLSWFSEPKKAR